MRQMDAGQIRSFVETYYADTLEEMRGEYDDRAAYANALFIALVDVADAYVRELESQAGEHAAPYLGVTPIQAAMRGLEENLHMRRDPTYGH